MKTLKEIKSELNAKIMAMEVKAKTKVRETLQWMSDNKELVAILTPVVIAGVKEGHRVVRSIDRKNDLRKEQELKDLYIYDFSTRRYVKLRRKMKNHEQIEYDTRKRNGESVTQVLASMGLLG